MEDKIQSIIGILQRVTVGLRDTVHKFAPDYLTLIILGASILAGVYLNKKYPNILKDKIYIYYIIIIFLVLRYV